MRSARPLSSPLLLLLLVVIMSSGPALAQKVVEVELLRGEKETARLTVTNRCRGPRTFELTETPETEWFRVVGESRRVVAPRGSWSVPFEFDSAGMDNGTHEGRVAVTCVDCSDEYGCGPYRTLFTLRMIVRRPPDDPELDDLLPDEFVAGEVLAVLKVKSRRAAEAAASRLALTHRLQRLSVYELRSISRFVAHFAILDPALSVASAVLRLELEPSVDYAQHVYRYFGFASGQRGRQDYTDRQHALGQIGADKAQRYSKGDGVKVAVLDTWIDGRHGDLKGKVVETKDFTDGAASGQETHGTSMAGVIAAVGGNRFGIDGVAPGARIISVIVLTQTSQRGAPGGTAPVVHRGLDYANRSRARVINMSYGLPDRDPTLVRLVKAAARRGKVLVAAAGNSGRRGKHMYPAALDGEVIAVSAVDKHGSFYSRGTQARYIDLAAPGVGILSTWPGDVFQYDDGTSLAAAHVSGVVALLLSKRPRTPPKRIKAVLEETAMPLGPDGKDSFFGSGLVDACKALEALAGGDLCR